MNFQLVSKSIKNVILADQEDVTADFFTSAFRSQGENARACGL